MKTLLMIISGCMVLTGKTLIVQVSSQSGTAIPASRIRCQNSDSCRYTDLNGYALIEYTNSVAAIRVSSSGYNDTVLYDIAVNDTLKVRLEEESVIPALPVLTTTAPAHHSIYAQLKNRPVQFSSSDIISTAGTAGDLSRYIATFPSAVASINEGYDNTLYIRGGRPMEVVFVIDGIDFDNINHFSKANSTGGPIGFINSDFVSIVNYYAGTMPAEYPSRLSSVIDIRLKNGSLTSYKGSGGAKWTGGMLSFEGPISQETMSIISAARYIDFSTLSKITKEKGIPKLGDLYAKLLFLPHKNLTISVSGLFSYNNLLLKYPSVFSSFTGEDPFNNVTNEIEHIIQGGGGAAIRYDNKISHEVIIGTSFRHGKRYDSISDFDSDFFRNRFAQNPVWENNVSKTNKMVKYKTQLCIGNGDSLIAGTNISSSSYSMKRGDYSQYFLGNQTEPVWLKKAATDHISFQGVDAGCFLGIQFQKWFIKTHSGIRYDYYGLLNDYAFSPSIIADFAIPFSGLLTISSGIYHQFPSEIPFVLFNTSSFQRSLTGSQSEQYEKKLLRQVKPYRCYQFGIGYKTTLFNYLYVKSDYYYKWYNREFKYSNPYTISIVNNKADGTYAIFNQNGIRKSTGMEIMINNGDQDKYRFSIGGSLFRSLNKYSNGNWYKDWTDVGYTLSLSNQLSFNHHEFSVTATAMGGRPYTSNENMAQNNWLSEHLDNILYVNFRYACKGMIRQVSVEGSFEIINLFNSQPALDYRFNGERYIKITPFGITPVLGLKVSI